MKTQSYEILLKIYTWLVCSSIHIVYSLDTFLHIGKFAQLIAIDYDYD